MKRFYSVPQLGAIVLALAGSHGWAQEATPPVAKSATADRTITLEITPKPATVPALRHRLIPRDVDRNPGNAAPIYLRVSMEMNEDLRRQVNERPQAWLELPFDKFPVAEARAFVNQFASRLLQFEYGAHRQSCDWNYTMLEEKDHIFEILLPDLQEMRRWGRVLALKARVEIAEGKFPEAARTIETGLAFSQHIAQGPFFINVLVGMSVSTSMLDRVDEWVGRPDAPSLYWPLTALPRPMISVRRSMENEQKTLDSFVPEVDDLERTRTEVEWSSLLGRLQNRLAYTQKLIEAGETRTGGYDWKNVDLAWLKVNLLPEAREFVRTHRGTTDGLTDEQTVILYVADRYREFRDDLFMPTFLPVTDASRFYAESSRRLQALKATPLGIFAAMAPAVAAVQSSEIRLDRKVAALRAVEAIRLQAQADGGRLPESLAKVTVVPVPLDPATNQPFDYRIEGGQAILTGPRASSELFLPEVIYRIRVRH